MGKSRNPERGQSLQHLFEVHAESIERAIARVCRDLCLDRASAEDFASSVRLSLLEDDCAILRGFQGRSSMVTYLTVVVRRLHVDSQRVRGRWYTSRAARRRGTVAVKFERLLLRDRLPFPEAAAIVRSEHPGITSREIEELATMLPPRALRPVLVPFGDAGVEPFVSRSSAADLVDALEVAEQSSRTNAVVRRATAAMSAEDRTILRLRFGFDASIASISRTLGLEQRPLYRRLEALLASLRRALESSGIDRASATRLIGTAESHLSFGVGVARAGRPRNGGRDARATSRRATRSDVPRDT